MRHLHFTGRFSKNYKRKRKLTKKEIGLAEGVLKTTKHEKKSLTCKGYHYLLVMVKETVQLLYLCP